ncbi:hypothetical protein, partial [Bacillus sp. WP8]
MKRGDSLKDIAMRFKRTVNEMMGSKEMERANQLVI